MYYPFLYDKLNILNQVPIYGIIYRNLPIFLSENTLDIKLKNIKGGKRKDETNRF